MIDHHVSKLEGITAALKKRNGLKRYSNVIDEELLKAGLGFYQFPDGNDLQIRKIDSFEKLVELKSEHGVALVKLQSHQVIAFRSYLEKKNEGVYKKGFEAIEKVSSKTELAHMTIEMEAAATVAAEFQASWNKGVSASAKLKVGVNMKLDGKYATFTAGASLSVEAKAQLHVNKVSLEASAKAEVEAKLQTKPMSLGGTSYSVSFYTEWKAYAKVEAKFQASLELSATNFINAEAKAKLFAGVGVSGEIGAELNGKYGNNPNNRLVGKLSCNASIEAGALIDLGAAFGATTSKTIGDDEFIKKEFETSFGLGVGATVAVNVLLLKEIQDDIQERIIADLEKMVGKLIVEDMLKYLEDKYEGFKKKATNVISVLGNDIYNKFHSESYMTMAKTMDTSFRKLDEQLAALDKKPNSVKVAVDARERLKKAEADLLKYRLRIEGIRGDCANVMGNVADLIATEDIDDVTRFTRSSKLLNEVEDAKSQVATMIMAIELVTSVNLEMIDLENMLNDRLLAEDLQTSTDSVLLANRAKMNELLNSQTYMKDSLDYITETLEGVLIEYMER
jgi:hypothetical protein